MHSSISGRVQAAHCASAGSAAHPPRRVAFRGANCHAAARSDASISAEPAEQMSRRGALLGAASLAAGALVAAPLAAPLSVTAASEALGKYEPMEALKGKDYGKPRMSYSDFTKTASGLQYLDLKVGEGEPAQEGETMVVDWRCASLQFPADLRSYPSHWCPPGWLSARNVTAAS